MKSIARLLLRHSAVKISPTSPFVWTSGIKSPVYCDNRLLTGFPVARDEIVNAFVHRIAKENIECDIIAGVATGSISWAALIAGAVKKPMVFVRGEIKKHGTKKHVEGFFEKGKKILVIEDLLSTGGSSVAAARILERECYADITGILSIMCWGLPALEKYKKETGYYFGSLTDFSEVIPVAVEMGILSAENAKNILTFRKNPSAWKAE